MIDVEVQWCKDFIASLNGRAPSAAELYDFLDEHIKTVEDAMDEGWVQGYEQGKAHRQQDLDDSHDDGYSRGWEAAEEFYTNRETHNG